MSRFKLSTVLILLLLLTVFIISAACDEPAQQPVPIPVSTPEPPPPTPSPTPDPTPEPVPISLNSQINEDHMFAFSSSELFARLDIPIAFTNDFNGYTVDWGVHEGIYPFFYATFTKLGNDFVSAISIEHTGFPNSRISNNFSEQLLIILDMCGIDGGVRSFMENSGFNNIRQYGEQAFAVIDEIAIMSDTNKDGTYEGAYFSFRPELNEIDSNNLPRRVQREMDFLTSDETREKLRNFLNDVEFSEIIGMAQEYIDVYDPSSSDNVFTILEAAQLAQDALDKCVIKHDSFDESYAVYFKGVENVSRTINMVPFYNGREARVIVGFTASNWVFFEKVRIKVGESEYVSSNFSYFDVTRDTVRGGITEYIETWFNVGETEQIINADSPSMRFEGDDKSRDHQLSNNEINALIAINDIHSARRSISTSLFSWEQLL